MDATHTASGLHLRARFPSRETLRAFQRAGAEIGSSVEVTRVYTESTAALGEYALTERQREAVVLAADRGYFETPSGVMLAELAETLDISPQAVSTHIRAAVRKLVEREIEQSITTDGGPSE